MRTGSHYETLGVSPDASADDIKRAYRKLAREFHPDRNPGDTDAEERFKQVGRAFEVLSDPTKRQLYDEMGDDAEKIGWDPDKAATYRQWAQQGGGRPAGGGGKGGLGVDLEDLLGGFGGGPRRPAGPEPGQDVRARIRIGFEEAVRGATREVRLDKPVACGTCQGRGTEGAPTSCTTCGGTGQTKVSQGGLQFGVPCGACGGSGRRAPACATCGGEGSVNQSVRLDVKIPPGVEDGQRIRLSGQGAPGRRGGPPGDLYLSVSVAEHPYYRRDGRDLYVDVPVTLPEALTGAEVEIPSLDGRVKLKIPAGAKPGGKLRLRGKGVPAHGRHAAGDLYAVIDLRLPERSDPEAVSQAAALLAPLYDGTVRDW